MASRKEQLEEWSSVQKGLEEALVLLETTPDDENMELCADFETQLADCVAALNASEKSLNIAPTPNTKFVRLADQQTVCLYAEAAPYQVHFDGKKWYSCVITNIKEPADKLDRVKYCVWILGYNIEEVVLAEELRRWQLDLPEPILSGQPCYAIHPASGVFRNAKVDKITPKNTVVVKMEPKASGPPTLSATEGPAGAEHPTEEVEVPISHMLNGKWYPQLRKIEKLTAAAKKAVVQERKAKKREREQETKATAAVASFNAMQSNQDFLDAI
eukprot:GILI01033379.1.p1 GENE.GILI01033379.1~~GILI01033379.1.p1  ORF type:complete len:288 (-),score=41.87 GILI01033379.1:53-868(-)